MREIAKCTCGARLDVATNGHGVVTLSCPHCHGGKPRPPRPVWATAAVADPVSAACQQCGATIEHRKPKQRYCIACAVDRRLAAGRRCYDRHAPERRAKVMAAYYERCKHRIGTSV
jgi:hypothetical protein